jgi:large subunit ribosomal protein L30
VIQKAQSTILIKWVRSGIGFSHHQKEMVRSLGLRRLNQVVERPDNPQIRGLVAKIPHLVQIVTETRKPAWAETPEYKISAPEAAPAARRLSEPKEAKATGPTAPSSEKAREGAGEATE